ncbi:hypothetical protein [Stutzerimonas kunmingensis]|uniref:hypothetical protein n=1 Tax=Stutzerimonas kunmingensis TaxID=1211807 RepID=UPI00289B37BD|nr:hypothetical protein [Stutzerimonas kunmingensis]
MSLQDFPIDTLSLSIARADAVLALISTQFDDPDADQHPAEVNSDAIGAVRTELAAVRALIAEQLRAGK